MEISLSWGLRTELGVAFETIDIVICVSSVYWIPLGGYNSLTKRMK